MLKARAAVEFDDGERHLVDLALLLALPVDVMEARQSLSKRERQHLDRAFKRIDDAVWDSLAAGLDPREGRAAMRLLLAP